VDLRSTVNFEDVHIQYGLADDGMKRLVRDAAHLAFTLHIYFSMAGFVLVLLFAVTGLTLNHDDFGWSEPTTSTRC